MYTLWIFFFPLLFSAFFSFSSSIRNSIRNDCVARSWWLGASSGSWRLVIVHVKWDFSYKVMPFVEDDVFGGLCILSAVLRLDMLTWNCMEFLYLKKIISSQNFLFQLIKVNFWIEQVSGQKFFEGGIWIFFHTILIFGRGPNFFPIQISRMGSRPLCISRNFLGENFNFYLKNPKIFKKNSIKSLVKFRGG